MNLWMLRLGLLLVVMLGSVSVFCAQTSKPEAWGKGFEFVLYDHLDVDSPNGGSRTFAIIVYVKTECATKDAIQKFSQQIKRNLHEEKRISVMFFADRAMAEKFKSLDDSVSESDLLKAVRGIYFLSREGDTREIFEFLPNGATEEDLARLGRDN